jgi:hypothetical protein
MRIVIRPSASPERELDVTQAVVAAVAHELWKHCGGNEVLNWVEAERQVARLLPAGGPTRAGRSAGVAEPKRGGRNRGRTTTLHPPVESDVETVLRT